MKLLDSLPANRLISYVLMLGLLPFLFAIAWFYTNQNQLQETAALFEMVSAQALVKERKQSQNQTVIKTFQDQDHFYIDKHLETLVFLEHEIEQLEKLVNGSVPISELLLKRYDKLTSQENQMRFVEGQVQSNTTFQEVTETLSHPVEVNITDIHKILAKIEGVEMDEAIPSDGRPQLLITDFKIEKKKTHASNEAFVLQLKLLKREYL